MPSSRSPLRLLRGVTAATLVTLVALGGHLIGGGAVPSWFGVALPWWLSVTACTVLAGARFSLPRMGVAVLSSQALFHGLFVAGTPGDPSIALVAPPGSHLGHGTHGAEEALTGAVHSGHGSDEVAAAAEHALHGSHTDPQMLLWHLMAGLVTTLVLHRGESVLLRCTGLVVAVLDVLSRPPHPLTLPTLVLPRASRPVPHRATLHHLRRAVLAPQLRRGPSVDLAA
ncbi:hypothetical protein CFK38_03170 [Brachybacterium vulturis]|uniref:Uncharacterized protein n=1 Tax=Brachybacterium vulturis TaxID=2017484 RepID=A0A291GS74_9MICO|nr:hypothetical protein [Brachybacterium vulturis]ATG53085.1 hypothetical protein CFK38_03170 [Brachybacterium vulturis]